MINSGELFIYFCYLLRKSEKGCLKCSVYREKKCVLMLFDVCTWMDET